MNMTRRELMGAAAAGIALTRCGNSSKAFSSKDTVIRPRPVSNVSITKAPAYTMDVYDAVYRIVAQHNLNIRGKRIVLKPNLVEFDPHTAINTHPVVVHAAYEAFRK